MTRQWNGVRPYPNRALSLEAMEASREAYDLAMNDPRVRGLYEELKAVEWQADSGYDRAHCPRCMASRSEGHQSWCKLAFALAAYDKDLVPEPEEEHHASR